MYMNCTKIFDSWDLISHSHRQYNLPCGNVGLINEGLRWSTKYNTLKFISGNSGVVDHKCSRNCIGNSHFASLKVISNHKYSVQVSS